MDERDKIEAIMQKENMNSTQFAVEIGIQSSTLSHILNGRNKPSLDVLKRILNRFRIINPDWLILGVGSMYRQERNSQGPTLFDIETESNYKSIDYVEKSDKKNTSNYEQNGIKRDSRELLDATPIITKEEIENISPASIRKKIEKIIIYYSDNTFEEFQSK